MKKHKLDKVFVATDSDGEGSDSLSDNGFILYDIEIEGILFSQVWLPYLKIYCLRLCKHSQLTIYFILMTALCEK